jgi:hypothetical protein
VVGGSILLYRGGVKASAKSSLWDGGAWAPTAARGTRELRCDSTVSGRGQKGTIAETLPVELEGE